MVVEEHLRNQDSKYTYNQSLGNRLDGIQVLAAKNCVSRGDMWVGCLGNTWPFANLVARVGDIVFSGTAFPRVGISLDRSSLCAMSPRRKTQGSGWSR